MSELRWVMVRSIFGGMSVAEKTADLLGKLTDQEIEILEQLRKGSGTPIDLTFRVDAPEQEITGALQKLSSLGLLRVKVLPSRFEKNLYSVSDAGQYMLNLTDKLERVI